MKKNYSEFIDPNFFTNPAKSPIRAGFGQGLVLAGDANESVVALCCDLVESTKTDAFAKKYPLRYFEIGVAEQNLVGVGAGLALSGKIPFVTSYAVFCPGRAWDQVRVSVCYNQANVKIVGSHAGLSVGPDGATHQALEDIAITRVLPNMTVVVPCDAIEARKATVSLAEHQGPAYLRLAREATAIVTTENAPFVLGRGQILRSGKNLTIIACGSMVAQALLAAEKLTDFGLDIEVINMATIKPLDRDLIKTSVEKTKQVVTIEEHQVAGGLGGAVAEYLGELGGYPVEIIGMPDSFGESGKPKELWQKYGLDVESIVTRIIARYAKKSLNQPLSVN